MDKYFPFHRLQEFYDIFSAVWIFCAVILVVYVLASLYYHSTAELKVRQPDTGKSDKDLT